MNLKDLKKDCAQKQKKGIHFIIASVVIWIMVLIVQLTDLPILTKNLLTFCCTARGRKIFCVYGEKSSLIRTRYV